jgi:CRP-like cAMP-binding protein
MLRDPDIAASRATPASLPVSVLSGLSDKDRLAIQGVGRPVGLQRGEHLYLAGAQEPCALFIDQGLVRVTIDFPDGDGVLATLVGPGGAAGLAPALAGRPPRHTVTALSETKGLTVSGGRLRQLAAERPHLLALCLGLLAEQEAGLEVEIACAARHRIEQRMARLLLTVREHLGRNRFDLRQEELARMVGVQRTTVSMLAQGLKAKGLLAYRRGVVQIADPAGLAAVSCGCGCGKAAPSAGGIAGSDRCPRTRRGA